MEQTQYPEADDVAQAVEHALSFRVPRHFHDKMNSHVVEDTIRWQIRQLMQLNEGHPTGLLKQRPSGFLHGRGAYKIAGGRKWRMVRKLGAGR